MPTESTRRLILASTSRYRREMLSRLRLPFDCLPPEVDETPMAGETPAALAARLATAKAQAIASQHPESVVIGSDQVADFQGEPVGKPGTHDKAVDQLRRMRGHTITFHTAVAVHCVALGYAQSFSTPVAVVFRDLTDADIETYLRIETPYDCAGSAKSEGLGIALLTSIQSDDPTALIGLPLIRTAALLRETGIDPLRTASTDAGHV